ncbi:hypothetical protein HYX04_00710 [Candidatus Woesearchaeota archaeon]|nr:hypothetical protein [Candidatus Woesearchaeota archaeon]
MNKIGYDVYGRNVATQLPLFVGVVPGIGSVQILTTNQPSKKGIFYLEDHFVMTEDGRCSPRHFPTSHISYDNVFEAIRANYPTDMLPSDSKLYAIANGEIWEGRTKKPAHDSLEKLVTQVEDRQENAAIVSFGRRDFEAFSSITESRNFWGTAENAIGDLRYIVYIHGQALHRPPKYKRKK